VGPVVVEGPESAAQDGPEVRLADAMEAAANEALLSPRVVDQRAFDELAAALQALMRQAASQGRGLAGTAAQVRLLGEQLRGLARDVQARTEGAGKVLPVLDAKLLQAQQVLHRVTGEAALQRARELRDAVLKELDATRGAIVQECVAAAASLARARIEQEAAGWTLSSPGCGNEASAAGATATTPDARACESRGLAETLAEASRRALDEVESGVAMAEARLSATQDATERLLAQAEAGQRSLEEAHLRAQVRTEATLADHQRRVEDVAGEIAAQLAALRQDARATVECAIGEVREAGARATRERGAGDQGTTPAPAGARAGADAQAEELRSATDDVALARDRAVERVLAAGDSTRRAIDDAIASALDRLGRATIDAREQARTLLGEAEEARRALRGTIDQANGARGDATGGSGGSGGNGMPTPDAGQLLMLGTQLHQMGAWLTQLLHAAQIEGARLGTLRMGAAWPEAAPSSTREAHARG
jgi:hypothetical protein